MIDIQYKNSNFGKFLLSLDPSLKFVPQTVKRKKMWSTSNYFVPFHGSWQRKNERERLLQTNEPALHLFFSLCYSATRRSEVRKRDPAGLGGQVERECWGYGCTFPRKDRRQAAPVAREKKKKGENAH